MVRVRATVVGANIDDTIWFRAFDVDDPSDDVRIDPNDKAPNPNSANDNWGTLISVGAKNGPGVHTPATRATRSGYSGRLRAVNFHNGINELDEDWTLQNNLVAAKVKAGPAGTLIAEVDLLTSFAPGDNFRVAAVPDG